MIGEQLAEIAAVLSRVVTGQLMRAAEWKLFCSSAR